MGKMKQNKLRLFEHIIMRRDDADVVRVVLEMEVEGIRG